MMLGFTRSPWLRPARFSAVAATLSLVAASAAYPAIAQESSATTAPAETVCMVRQRSLEERVAIVLPARHAEPMAREGYVVAPCVAAFAEQGSRAAWRDRVCHLASIADTGLQVQLEQMLGGRAAVLCAMAEVTVGKWQRTQGQR